MQILPTSCIGLRLSEARFPFKRNRLRCVNENRKKRKRLRWQAANHGYHFFDRAANRNARSKQWYTRHHSCSVLSPYTYNTYYTFGKKFAKFNKLYNVNEFYVLQNEILISYKKCYNLVILTSRPTTAKICLAKG